MTNLRVPVTMRTLLAAYCLWSLVCACNPGHAQNWSRFRGPDGSGISELKGVPSNWTVNDYAWSADLPGTGHGSPVIWEKQLFVTSAEDDGTRTMHCFDAETGKELWRHSMKLSTNHLHKMNSYASGTPTVDGDRVYIAFADADHYHVMAYSMKGEPAWSRDLGPCITEHGHGVSPILFKDLLIVCNDQGKQGNSPAPPSAIMALNRATGETVWVIDRTSRESSYSTPLVITLPGREPELVVMSGANGMSGLDPLNGKQLWSTGSVPQRTVSSPSFGSGRLVATCGSGGRGESMICVDPLAKNGEEPAPLQYVRPKAQGVPYVPTPIIHQDRIYLWNDDGTFFIANLSDGKTITKKRVGGSFFASPVMLEGRLFNISHDGDIVVINVKDDEINVEGTNPLGDSSYASPAVGNGAVYFRGFHKIVCLKAHAG